MTDPQEKIQQLQLLEQSLQQLLMQKQNLQMQLAEIESASTELSGKESAYKIIGNIMVTSKAADLLKDLQEKKETLELRLKSLDKQESSIKEKADALQKDVLENMKEK